MTDDLSTRTEGAVASISVTPAGYILRMHALLDTVTVRELSRRPGRVLARVVRGERLLVCSRGRPIATLQPLDGVVVQPLVPAEYDPKGSPLSDAAAEVQKLSEVQCELLRSCIVIDRFVPTRLGVGYKGEEVARAMDDLIQRGLARHSGRGRLVTGRGLVLHEHLVAKRGGTREVKPDPRLAR